MLCGRADIRIAQCPSAIAPESQSLARFRRWWGAGRRPLLLRFLCWFASPVPTDAEGRRSHPRLSNCLTCCCEPPREYSFISFAGARRIGRISLAPVLLASPFRLVTDLEVLHSVRRRVTVGRPPRCPTMPSLGLAPTGAFGYSTRSAASCVVSLANGNLFTAVAAAVKVRILGQTERPVVIGPLPPMSAPLATGTPVNRADGLLSNRTRWRVPPGNLITPMPARLILASASAFGSSVVGSHKPRESLKKASLLTPVRSAEAAPTKAMYARQRPVGRLRAPIHGRDSADPGTESEYQGRRSGDFHPVCRAVPDGPLGRTDLRSGRILGS